MTEAIYDAKVAPALMKVGKVCQDNGMSIIAMVEYAPGKYARVAAYDKPSRDMQIAIMGANCKGNVDALIMGLMEYGRVNGHSSILLKKLGVPTKPVAKS